MCNLLRFHFFLKMQQESGERIPCLSGGETTGLPSDQSRDPERSRSGTRQASDWNPNISPLSSHRSILRYMTSVSNSSGMTDVEDDVVSQHPDSSKPIPRVLSFSWSSFVTDVISVLSTIPFIVLACLLARANGKPVHQASDQNFSNGTRVVSLNYSKVFLWIYQKANILLE